MHTSWSAVLAVPQVDTTATVSSRPGHKTKGTPPNLPWLCHDEPVPPQFERFGYQSQRFSGAGHLLTVLALALWSAVQVGAVARGLVDRDTTRSVPVDREMKPVPPVSPLLESSGPLIQVAER
jgi:hypothetical protein